MRRIAIATMGLAVLVAIPLTTLAAGPALSATTTRQGPATIIDLAGAGFGPNSQVQLDISRNGDAVGTQALVADAGGGFSTTLEYGPGQGGRYTFTATSPAGTASTEVVVVETAGAGTGGPGPTMPATNVAPPSSGPAGGRPGVAVAPIVVALLVSFVVSLGLGLATIEARAHRS